MWSTFALGWRQLVTDWRRYVVAGACLALAVALLLGTWLGLGSVSRQLSSAANSIKGLGEVSVMGTEGTISAEDLQALSVLPEVEKVIPFYTMTSMMESQGSESQINVTGVPFEDVAAVLEPAVDGRLPGKGGNEVLIPSKVAAQNGLCVGDVVTLATVVEPVQVYVVGLLDETRIEVFTVGNIFMPIDRVQVMDGAEEGSFTRVDLKLSNDVSASDWTSKHMTSLMPRMSTYDLSSVAGTFAPLLSAVNTVLLACVGVAVVMAIALTAMAVRTAVSERQTTYAVMRTVGASGAWVARILLAEIIILSLISSIVGALLGVGVGYGLAAAMTALGQSGDVSVAINWQEVLGAVLLGVASGLVGGASALAKILRSPLISSLRVRAVRQGRLPWVTGAIGVIMAAIGGMIGWLIPSNVTNLLGFALCLLGSALVSPLVLAFLVRLPVRRSWQANAAATHLQRIPSGGAIVGSFAALVCLGTTLLMGVTSIGDAMTAQMSRQFGADIQVESTTRNTDGSVSNALSGVQGIEVVSGSMIDKVKIKGTGVETQVSLRSIDPSSYFKAANFQWVTGGIETASETMRSSGAALLPAALAKSQGVSIGDEVTLTRQGVKVSVPVAGTFTSLATGDQIVTDEGTARSLGLTGESIWNAAIGENYSADSVLAEVETALAAFPGIEVTTSASMQAEAASQLAGYTGTVMAFAVLLFVLGAIATSGLFGQQVLTRSKEFATLRAIGASGTSVSLLVIWEAVYFTAAACVTGVIIALMAAGMMRGIVGSAMNAELQPPKSLVTIIGVCAAAILAMIGAAWLPSRRARRIDPIRVLRAE